MRHTEEEIDEWLKYIDPAIGIRKIKLPNSWIAAAPSSDYESTCCRAAIYAHRHSEDACVVMIDGGYIHMTTIDCISFYGQAAHEIAECIVTKDGTLIKARHHD